MKISHSWLQTFFKESLPDAQALADALTFHAFEIESVEQVRHPMSNFILDVKVTPNRGHDCLSHRGIAKELSAILNIPMRGDPLREPVSLSPDADLVSVSIDTPLCSRYIAGYIRGVKVGPSPHWLRAHLESIGQKSINNIVDAANFVMFNIGQPLHAFDAGRLVGSRQPVAGSTYKIQIRNAKRVENISTLDGKEYELSESMLVIADGNSGKPIAIAGVKGGKHAEVTEATIDIILESANFDGVLVRKTAQALKLRTDASERFQQGISPELAAYGMRAVTDLIINIAGGELVGFVDEYPWPQEKKEISVSLAKVNAILGTKFTESQVTDVFNRLGLPHKCSEVTPRCIFKVEGPFERLDLEIPEDLVEEIARIEGYDKIPSAELPPSTKKPEMNPNFYAAEKIREKLISQGYSEVVTSVFRDRGERSVLNKIESDKPYLRDNLQPALVEAWARNSTIRDLLGLKTIKIFEIGTVWKEGKELTMFGTVEGERIGGTKASETSTSKEQPLEPQDALQYENLPVSGCERYQPFSKYPFIVRDIALWTSEGTKPEDVLEVIRKESGELLVRSEIFDTFEKAGRISYAFRLILQSFEKTLTDEEANAVMAKVYKAVKKEGWEVR